MVLVKGGGAKIAGKVKGSLLWAHQQGDEPLALGIMMFLGLEVGSCFLQGRCLRFLFGCYIEGRGGDMTSKWSRFANGIPKAVKQFVLPLLQREVRARPLWFSGGQRDP